MTKIPSPYIKVLLYFGTISFLTIALAKAVFDNKGFKDDLLEFIQINSEKKSSPYPQLKRSETTDVEIDEIYSPFSYKKGDWGKYVIIPKINNQLQSHTGYDYYIDDEDDVALNSYGSMSMNLLYGKSEFTSSKYKRFDQDKPVSKIIDKGFNPEHNIQLHMEGKVGRRLNVYIDHDSKKNNNHYLVKYRAVNDDEVIREVNAGEIDINLPNSKYVVFDESSIKGLGMDMTLKKGGLMIKAFGSVAKGETEIEIFQGNSSAGNNKLAEYQYIRNTYFQLEAFKRYDNLTNPPTAADDPYNTLITFTSKPSDPEKYRAYPVDIDHSNFELFMDDQDSLNNLNTVKLNNLKGDYDILVSGIDYIINYSTGVIIFMREIDRNSIIGAAYTINNGSIQSSDPTARTDVISGKIFVYIKYGYSIDEDINKNFDNLQEDRNGDGMLNLDIYEVRSYYDLGDSQLLEDNFKIQFLYENEILKKDEASLLGSYSVDYSNGILSMYLREPFRQLLGERGSVIYSENQADDLYLSSIYSIKVDYYRKARSFQLKHSNIIPESERIKINDIEIISSLYTIDYTSGFLEFTDPNNPIISQDTKIEVKYEYMPFASKSQSFIGGVRTDLQVNRSLNIGGSLLYSGESENGQIPDVGNEPEQILVLEGDSSLHLGEGRLKRLIKNITGYKVDSVPLEIEAYGEYARSYKKVNAFGKALVDNMESTDEILPVSLSDADWTLSSMPEDADHHQRGILYYRYYRNPSNPDTLKGIDFTPYDIAYAVKPGPYNIATGHLDNSILSESSQLSLSLKFDFSGNDYVSITTRSLSTEAVDFSGLQYVEIWYRSEGGSGSVDLYLDIGQINEDSDHDGVLDTEDDNGNGYLDYDPSSGINEDQGYEFNLIDSNSTHVGGGPRLNRYTKGDGKLNSEDKNGNGILDQVEDVITLPGSLTLPNTSLTIDLSNTEWRKARIYLDRSSINLSQRELLKRIESVRLYLKRNNSDQGTIHISSLRFVSSSWRDIELNDIPHEDPSIFQVTMVDSYNDDDYAKESFMISNKNKYTSLYGERSNDELESEREGALQIIYNNLSLEGGKGSVTKRFPMSLDMRYYKRICLWFNYRSFSSGDELGIILGSSEGDFLEYRFPMDYLNVWREVSLKLKDGSESGIDILNTVGHPDMKRISYIKIIIYGNNGKLWINDIYLNDSDTLKDSAYWYEGKISFKRPLYITSNGLPVCSDFNISYIQKGHGSNFYTLGKTTEDIKEEYRELLSSIKILPNWGSNIGFILEESDTESYNEDVSEKIRGECRNSSLIFESDYISNINAFPSIKAIYKQDYYENRREEDLSGFSINRQTKRRIYTPNFILHEKVEDFLGGRFSTVIHVDLYFKEEKVNRDSDEIDDLELEEYVSALEEEMRQRSGARINMHYRNKIFFIYPSMSVSSHEVVKLKGKSELNDTEVLNDVNGGFHFPLIYNKDFKFVEREKKFGLKYGVLFLKPLFPNLSLDLSYNENRFKDYDENQLMLSGKFSRAKDSDSMILNRIELPFEFRRNKNVLFLKNLNLGYSRSIYFHENNIPYEGEGISSFDERYGVKRVYNKFSRSGINLFHTPPWYFFQGRENYANGRDYVYNTFNEGLVYFDGSDVTDYNNTLRIIDNYWAGLTFDFGRIILDSGGGITQVTERQMIYGIPRQVITVSYNIKINFDLMKIFNFWFFRSNEIGQPFHSSNLLIGYNFNRNMLITSNIEEYSHSPNVGITFKWDRSSVGLRLGLDYMHKSKREFISQDDSKRSSKDDIYINNMQTIESFKEVDYGYQLSVLYETDVQSIYNFFSQFYKLVSFPIVSLEYSLLLNRYDYSETVSPEPYDQHLVTGKLTMDLHENIQGGVRARYALERFRNRDTEGINREIRSYEIALNFSLLF